MLSAARGGALKFGDHGDFAPRIHNEPIMTTASTTIAMDHGRRQGLRSPLFDKSGGANSSPPTMSGAARMTNVSSSGGMSARTAKYQSRYQSGFGSASMRV